MVTPAGISRTLRITGPVYQTIDGLPNIPSVADDINMRLDGLLADPESRHARLGVLAMDFVTAARARAIVATNAAR